MGGAVLNFLHISFEKKPVLAFEAALPD